MERHVLGNEFGAKVPLEASYSFMNLEVILGHVGGDLVQWYWEGDIKAVFHLRKREAGPFSQSMRGHAINFLSQEIIHC